MAAQISVHSKPRVAFLLVLAILVSLVFFWVIKEFLLAVFMAAVLAGLLHPFYRKLLKWLGDRKGLAASGTVTLSLLLIIIPGILFFGIVLNEANQMGEVAKEWLASQEEPSAGLQARLKEAPHFKQLLHYQHELIEKANQLAAKAGGWVAQALAAGLQGTANFFLTLFVMLYAMSFFLTDGRGILDAAMRHTPLSKQDQSRLLGTFVSVARATLKGKLIIGPIIGSLYVAVWQLWGSASGEIDRELAAHRGENPLPE